MDYKPKLETIPSLHPSLTRPCAYCGEMTVAYSKVYRLSFADAERKSVLLHPACLFPFAHWMSEIAARAF
jgi:hypothetical protein